jgi:hypothetical protein
MRDFLDAKLEQLPHDQKLEITPRNPQGDDIQYALIDNDLDLPEKLLA